MEILEIVKREHPVELREFAFGTFAIYRIAGREIGVATYQPGWRWSTHVAPLAGSELCEVEHLGIVLAGSAAVQMADGQEQIMSEGDLFAVPAGHDSWVLGSEPYLSLHLLGAEDYARAPGSTETIK